MSQYMLIFVSALLFSVLGTPMAKRVALHLHVVDIPQARKIHLNPVPLLGGVAIYLALLFALIIFGQVFFISQLLSIVLGGSLIAVAGAWDDKWGLPPIFKIAGQVAAAGVLIISGIRVEFLHNDILNAVVTVIWIVGITNAFNLLDNMDGLSGGVAAIASAFFFLLAAMNGQYLVAVLAAATAGACSGFLYYNLRPAHIFMGDIGSLFLGFVLSAEAIKLRFPGHLDLVTWMVPAVVLGLPIFDTTLVVISRLRRRLPVYQGGRDHFSHRLVAIGMSKREAVLTLYLVTCGLGMAALFLMQVGVLEGYVVAASLILIALGALIRLERVSLPPAQSPGSTGAQEIVDGLEDAS
ncbi:MAG: undecaprenyl/decaprenyl-phosphate alpha-N-acetylglucosaminyl 1-phosphate transferase [Chloroflexi bacterium]|nr:undecaprenyl/decaprenyl-phosphate alpha-N-acetylglucosaminyl 1-phosphate transferase [Chloroflexota bacterium]